MTLRHGTGAGILSAIHVFDCVRPKGQQGVTMVNGCHFLLSGKQAYVVDRRDRLLRPWKDRQGHLRLENGTP